MSVTSSPSALIRDRIFRETFIREAEYFHQLPSTNDYALQLVAETELTTPRLIWAAEQTQGRGRGANRWWSAKGALTFSLVLSAANHGVSDDRLPRVSLAAALAVCEAVEDCTGVHAQLKWPNDVYVAERKLSGVLVEVPASRQRRIIVGIGINVNNSFDGAPEELRQTANSLADATGRVVDQHELLIRILLHIEQSLAELTNNDERLQQRFQQRCLLSGRTITLQVGDRQVTGRALGIHRDGAIVLETERGQEVFYAGVVKAFSESP